MKPAGVGIVEVGVLVIVAVVVVKGVTVVEREIVLVSVAR